MGLARFLGGIVTETVVDRDSRGHARSIPAGQRRYDEIRAYARRARVREDRVGPPVRFAPDVDGWWYMVKGPQRWIRQQDRPGWHHGFYYKPGRWMPVVPPVSDWSSRTAYAAPPGTPRSSVVPEMVSRAARLQPEELRGHRRDDGSPRAEAKARSMAAARTRRGK